MDIQAIILASLRGFHLLALASLFGTLVSLALVAPAGLRDARTAAAAARQRLVRLARWSDALALLIGVSAGCWCSRRPSPAPPPSAARFAALVTVAHDTQFGHLVLLRLRCCCWPLPCWAAVAGAWSRRSLLTGAALAMQGGVGHAGATGGTVGAMLLVSEALHLLAAGAWLGGLLPLFLLAGALPPRAAATACEHFTPVGLSAVLVIACTAVVQAWQLIGSLAGLFGTAYGHIALLKLALFLALLLLAGINRFVLTDRLRDPAHPVTRTLLRSSLGVETLLGAAVILVAAFLASGIPATHETPVWPFSRRPAWICSLTRSVRVVPAACVGAQPDRGGAGRGRPVLAPDFLAGAGGAGRMFGPGMADHCAAADGRCLSDDFRYLADGVCRRLHHARRSSCSQPNCTMCHGAERKGNGPAAKSLPIPPADLTAPHFWAHTEGDLYWYIAHGIEAPPGVPAMPAFGETLSSGNIWALIDFLKANNAGSSMRTTGRGISRSRCRSSTRSAPMAPPSICDDLRNRVVHIIAGGQDGAAAAGACGHQRRHHRAGARPRGEAGRHGLRHGRAKRLGCVRDAAGGDAGNVGRNAGAGRPERLAAAALAAGRSEGLERSTGAGCGDPRYRGSSAGGCGGRRPCASPLTPRDPKGPQGTERAVS